MGRKSARTDAVPNLRVRKKGKKTFYYYDHGGKPRREEPLGSDYGLAIMRWAEIRRDGDAKPAAVVTFSYVATQYFAEVVPTKGQETQKDNKRELKQLLRFFNNPPGPLDGIEPKHVKQYLRIRGAKAKVRANREKALLSHIWNWARETGFTSLPNPCAGVKGFTEKGREDVYIEDEVFQAVWDAGQQPLRDAMDLAYLTAQRVADTLKMDERHIKQGFLEVTQNKRGAKRRIEIVGELDALLKRISARKATYKVHSTKLVVGEKGQPLTYRMLCDRFYKARELAGIEIGTFQFRDLRAKAGTDKADSSQDIRQAQKQLGHSSVVMTEHYTRKRRGEKVTPTR